MTDATLCTICSTPIASVPAGQDMFVIRDEFGNLEPVCEVCWNAKLIIKQDGKWTLPDFEIPF